MILHILAGTTKVDGCPELEREAAVMFIEGCALPMVFDDAADAEGFIEWVGGSKQVGVYRWDGERLIRLASMWRDERGWAKCPAHDHPEYPCRGRVRPGDKLCESCEGDVEFAAELAAGGATG